MSTRVFQRPVLAHDGHAMRTCSFARDVSDARLDYSQSLAPELGQRKLVKIWMFVQSLLFVDDEESSEDELELALEDDRHQHDMYHSHIADRLARQSPGPSHDC